MAILKDSAGREWQLHLTVAALRRIREHTGHNLYRLYEPPEPLLAVLQVDDAIVLEICFAACRKVADERKVDLDAFLDAFDGEAVKPACQAFLKELDDFFRRSGRSEDATLLAAAGRKIEEQRSLTKAKLGLTTSSDASTSPPSPESNPGTTPPAN